MCELERFDYFPSSIFKVGKPEFLEDVKKVSYEYIDKTRNTYKIDEIYPVLMTENIAGDQRLLDFQNYICQTSWDILNAQGYYVNNKQTYLKSMWIQEHGKYSSMDQHVHSGLEYIVGFYVLDCKEDGSKVLFHDPRPGKVQTNIGEKDTNVLTYASDIINFSLEPGTMIFSNSWVPHSFTRNPFNEPMRFIHFCISLSDITEKSPIII